MDARQFFGLNVTEVETVYTRISTCKWRAGNQGKRWSVEALEVLHRALQEIPTAGGAFGPPWYSLFTRWSAANEKLFKPLEVYPQEIEQLKAAYEKVHSILSAQTGLDVWEFYSECTPQ